MTSGASTCIVLAAHNDSEKQGLIGHFTAISEPKSVDNSSQSFVDAVHAVKDIGDPGETTIWVGGGMPFADRYGKADSVEPDREFAKRIIGKLRLEIALQEGQVIFDWSDVGRVVAVVFEDRKSVVWGQSVAVRV